MSKLNRRQPLLEKRPEETMSVRKEKRRVGEVVGGTAADCTAICCCCPCMTVHLLVLAVYKVPSAIVRKAWRKQRRRKLNDKNSLLLHPKQQNQHNNNNSNNIIHDIHDRSSIEVLESNIRNQTSGEDESTEEDDEFERKMLSHFYNTGFWRSPSQREEIEI